MKIAPCGSDLAPAVAPGRPLAMVAPEGATEPSKKKPTRESDKYEAVNSAGAPKVKLEARSDAGKLGTRKRGVEERTHEETKRKTAVAVPEKDRSCTGTDPKESESYEDSSSSDHSVSPPSARNKNPATGSRHRHGSTAGGEAGRRNVKGRTRGARSRSSGHGRECRPRRGRGSTRNEMPAWRSDSRRDVFAKR